MTSPRTPPPSTESDRLPGPKLFGIYLVAILLTLGAILCSGLLLNHSRSEHGQSDRRGPGGERTQPRTIGMLEQTPIESTEVGRSLNARKRHELDHYGWADRKAGIARIPIDRAMGLVASDPSLR